MKVIVTGSRDYADRALVWSVLDQLLTEHRGLILAHGACPTGADKHADDWARKRIAEGSNVLLERHPADWVRYDSAAGPRRNRDMIAAGARLVLAFFQPGASNSGTAGAVKLARRALIEVREYGKPEPAEPVDALF